MQSSKDVEAQTIFDVERDHYQLVYVGWSRNDIRDYGCLLHLDIKDEKIWIQYDGTEGSIAYELLKLGVPREDIVLEFQPLRVLADTEFAVG
ncbi:XisI protein [Pseudanabaena sp. Chao 1811]|uniref:XisI protein n=1 Tax=Pseudanabaena sp. Chao 1811 TaxID=2963092 RepID=UPI0031F65BE6